VTLEVLICFSVAGTGFYSLIFDNGFGFLLLAIVHFSAMNSTVNAADAASYLLTGLGRLLYIVSPSATSFSTLQEVPDYIAESIPFFVITIVLEFLSLLFSNHGKSLEKKRTWDANRFSINDAVGSMGVRIESRLSKHKCGACTYPSI
jgi:ABC-type uncharacterized transport system permease subunit